MKKSDKTKEILNEWRKFEFKQLNESQEAAERVRAEPTQRALDLKKKLEAKFGIRAFEDYSFFDDHFDDEMIIVNPDKSTEGFQVDFSDVANEVNNIGEIDITDMTLGDFIFAGSDELLGKGIEHKDLDITKRGTFQLSSGSWAEFGHITLDDEEIFVVWHGGGGYTYYKFIPTSAHAEIEYEGMKPGKGSYWD